MPNIINHQVTGTTCCHFTSYRIAKVKKKKKGQNKKENKISSAGDV